MMAHVRDAALRLGIELMRPILGGPTPVVTPGASGATPDGEVVATLVPSLGPNLGAAMLVLVGGAALIGLMRGVRREAWTVVVTAVATLAVGWAWPLLAVTVNRFWDVGRFVVQRAVLADGAAALGSTAPLPITDDTAAWQIGFFVFTVLIFGYGGSRILRGVTSGGGRFAVFPNLLDRLVGSMIGSLNGLMIGRFVLPRLVPEASVAMIGPGTPIYERLSPYGPWIALATVLLLILFGVTGISGGGPQQRTYS